VRTPGPLTSFSSHLPNRLESESPPSESLHLLLVFSLNLSGADIRCQHFGSFGVRGRISHLARLVKLGEVRCRPLDTERYRRQVLSGTVQGYLFRGLLKYSACTVSSTMEGVSCSNEQTGLTIRSIGVECQINRFTPVKQVTPPITPPPAALGQFFPNPLRSDGRAPNR